MRARLLAAVLPLAIIGAMPIARWIAPSQNVVGLTARYYANDSWTGPPVLESVDREISFDTIQSHPEVLGLSRFTVEWTATLVVRQAHLLRFITMSDDGSWLWINEHPVVDNGGIHAAQSAAGDIWLERGVHALRVRYLQAGGDAFLRVGQWWRGGAIVHPEVLPQPVSYHVIRLRQLWPLAFVAVAYVSLVPIASIVVRRLSASRAAATLFDGVRDPAFLAVATLGLAVTLSHIDYGVAEQGAFSADELTPIQTLAGASDLFREWNLRWPPGQPAMHAVVLTPFAAANIWAGLPLLDPLVAPLMLIVVRLVSIGFLFSTFALAFDIARTLADRRTALMTVALLALSPVVVYFGPLANLEIPHLFWVTLSWWAWIGFWRRRDLASSVVFGATVGVSLGVKDQAYAYYLAAPVAVGLTLWREPRERQRSIAAPVRDARLWAMGFATITSFAIAQGIPWAWDRFLRHMEVMTEVMVPFQMFPRSAVGYVQLLGGVAKTFVWAAGVPLAAAFVSGAVDEFLSRRGRRLLVLLVPVLTYVTAFLGVTMYVYDRFLIAALPVVSFVGGRFLSGLSGQRALPISLRVGIPALLVATGVINAAAQNMLFHRDARSDAAEWIARNIPCGASIGVSYDTGYVPPLGCFDVRPFGPDEIEPTTQWPEYFVFNKMYVSRFLDTPTGARFLEQLFSGELGHRPVFRSAVTVPRWAPLMWERRFRNDREDPETTLDKPINEIHVWKRAL